MKRNLWRVLINDTWYIGAYWKHLPFTPFPLNEKPLDKEYKHVLIKDGFSDWGLPRELDVIEIPEECLNTLCQCIGLKDQHDNLIFEHDICLYEDGMEAEILWNEEHAMFMPHFEKTLALIKYSNINSCVVVGNTFEGLKSK